MKGVVQRCDELLFWCSRLRSDSTLVFRWCVSVHAREEHVLLILGQDILSSLAA